MELNAGAVYNGGMQCSLVGKELWRAAERPRGRVRSACGRVKDGEETHHEQELLLTTAPGVVMLGDLRHTPAVPAL